MRGHLTLAIQSRSYAPASWVRPVILKVGVALEPTYLLYPALYRLRFTSRNRVGLRHTEAPVESCSHMERAGRVFQRNVCSLVGSHRRSRSSPTVRSGGPGNGGYVFRPIGLALAVLRVRRIRDVSSHWENTRAELLRWKHRECSSLDGDCLCSGRTRRAFRDSLLACAMQ